MREAAFSEEDVQRLALKLWWEREEGFPKFARRGPDDLDRQTGAWAAVEDRARSDLAWGRKPLPA